MKSSVEAFTASMEASMEAIEALEASMEAIKAVEASMKASMEAFIASGPKMQTLQVALQKTGE